jgi:hypothetical protein
MPDTTRNCLKLTLFSLTMILLYRKLNQDTVEVAQLHAQMGLLQRALLKDDLAQIHLQR